MVPTSFCSIDGVDFKILEPKPFSLNWFNHQFHGPELQYKIALSIRAGYSLGTGGYPCGELSVLKLARQSYMYNCTSAVSPGKETIVDFLSSQQAFT